MVLSGIRAFPENQMTVARAVCALIITANIFAQNKCEVTLSTHPVILVISFDGFRYDYLKRVDTPNLNRLKSVGVTVPYLKNQFITTTLPNHHSIATGLHVESHGVTSNYLYDPLYQRFLNGSTDPEYWNYSPDVLPLWTLNELAGDGRTSGAMMWPGCDKAFGIKRTLPTYFKSMNMSYPFTSRIDDVISWITNPHRPANLVFQYFEEPDYTGHSFGPSGTKVEEQICRMDNMTGYLLDQLDRLNITNRVNLILLSDHGMEDVKDNGEIDFENVMENTNNSRYTNYGSRSVLQLLPTRESDTMEIYRAFHAASFFHNFTAYLKKDLPILQPHWHYSKCRRIMPILVVADSGYVFSLPKHPGLVLHGMHGYDNANPQMRPFFIGAGPLFKKNVVMEPFENIDIFPLICHLLHIPTPPNNGTLSHVLPLLRTE